MARIIPNPLGAMLEKADRTLEQVDLVLERVDATLSTVSTTLIDVEGTLSEAASTLAEVRDLLVFLRVRLEVLDQVPLLAAQVGEIHEAVVGSSTKPPRAKKAG